MKGRVEVFCIEDDGSERLVAAEDNLIVDGAGQTIVDMLTIPSSLISVTPYVYDASNWRIKALTFGPAGGNFGNDPWYADTSCTDGRRELLGAPAYYVTKEAIEDPTSWVNVDRTTDKAIRVLWKPEAFPAGSVTASSYTPPYKLPSYPDTLDTRLEKQEEAYFSVSSTTATTSFGHFQNWISQKPNDASSYLFGAFADDTEEYDIYLVSSLEGDFVADPTLNVIASGTATATANGYNGTGNVSTRGFIKIKTMDVATTGTTGEAWVSGTGSQASPEDFLVDCKVQITTWINGQDLKLFSVYGGLHQIGLWTYDMKTNLERRITPPIAWTKGKNIAHRLFAKKTFTDNLVRVEDNGTSPGVDYSGAMILKWTIDLRSQA